MEPITNYDNAFNANEWFIIVTLILGYGLVLFLPKKYPTHLTILFLIIGMNSGVLFDHTISIPPFDFYDVNDSSFFEPFDFLSYIMYGPFAYLFFYFHKVWKIHGYMNLFYITMWSAVSMFMEGTATHFGVFHYKEGYRFEFSLPFYPYIQSVTLILYLFIMKNIKAAPSNKEKA